VYVLGWHGSIHREWQDMAPGWAVHDAAAVLLRDGAVVAAIEEERLNRLKHSNFFPRNAIRACLDEGGIGWDNIECVAVNFEEQTDDIFPGDIGRPALNNFLDDPRVRQRTVRDMLGSLFLDEFSVDITDRLAFCHHHLAHLWSAWGPAPYPDALTVSFDGSGDGLSGMVGIGGNDDISIIRSYDIDQSLGNLYADSIRLLGYHRFDEYKAMGLAPYGDPQRFESLFGELYELLPEGQYRIASRRDRWAILNRAGVVSEARRHDEEFSAVHADIAAALQAALERVVLHVLGFFRRDTGQSNLCLAGGVAHNCTLNGKILEAGLFESVFAQPAAHDAGGALGAALAATHRCGGSMARIDGCQVFTGRRLHRETNVSVPLRRWEDHIVVERVPNPSRLGAELLSRSQVIGWVHGRSEFGPRALGHRSILADPRPAANKDRINRMVKKRESFRPFAPAIRSERLGDVVELTDTTTDLSYMNFSLRVTQEAALLLGAVTHVDRSARVQSVSRSFDPLFWNLIFEFEHLTGVPAVLNTSFNNNAEPIVDSVDDAVACFLTTGLDAMIVEDFLVRRRRPLGWSHECEKLRVILPYNRKLVVRSFPEDGSATRRNFIDCTASKFFALPSVAISRSLYEILLRAVENEATIGELYGRCVLPADQRRAVGNELFSLWEKRVLVLVP
jgi:carbamoyltransferase